MRIASIDPGPTTGICVVEGNDIQVSHKPMTLGGLYTWLSILQPDKVICERFMFYKGEQRDYIDYSPAESVGVVRAFGELEHTEVILQNAAQAVGATAFWGDNKPGNDRIRQIGLWDRKYYPHGMDALRHYLYWVTFTQKDNRWLLMLK